MAGYVTNTWTRTNAKPRQNVNTTFPTLRETVAVYGISTTEAEWYVTVEVEWNGDNPGGWTTVSIPFTLKRIYNGSTASTNVVTLDLAYDSNYWGTGRPNKQSYTGYGKISIGGNYNSTYEVTTPINGAGISSETVGTGNMYTSSGGSGTAAKAPTSISITYNGTTVSNGGVLTVPTGVGLSLSWSGAKAGSSAITGYRVREKCVAGGGTYDGTADVSTSATSYSGFTDSLGYFNSSAVGKTYRYWVMTLCGSGNSDYSTAYVDVMPVASVATYTVSLNANSGTVSPTSKTGSYGSVIDMPIPTRSGYSFAGWYTNHTSSTSTAYDYGLTYKYAGNVSLSFWTDATTYATSDAELSVISCMEGSGYAFTLNSDGYVKWLTRTNGTTSSSSWATCSVPVSQVSAGRHYWNLIFDASTKKMYMYMDGVLKSSCSTALNSIVYNSTVRLRVGGEPSTGTTLEGARFTGKIGNLIITNSTEVRTEDSTISRFQCPNQNLTAYAYWLQNYTVSYNANGGSSTPESQTKIYGKTLVLADAISRANTQTTLTTTFNATTNGGASNSSATSTKTQPYSFNGWHAGSASGTTYAASGNYTANAATTMYAGWNSGTASYTNVTFPAIPSHANTTSTITRTVYYNANGGTGTTTAQSVSPTASITWTANKWWTAASSGTSYAVGTVITPTSSSTYYARYTSSTGSYNSPAVTLRSELTFANTVNTATTTITLNFSAASAVAAKTTTKTVTTSQPRKFDKWRLNSATGTSYAAGASFTPTATSTTFYATAINNGTATTTTTRGAVTLPAIPSKANGSTTRQYTVSYNANGGTGTTTAQTVTQSATITYSSAGWYTTSAGTGTAYSANSNYTLTADNGTLYATYAGTTGTYTSPSITLRSALTFPAVSTTTTTTATVSFSAASAVTAKTTTKTVTSTQPKTFDKWRLNSATGTSYAAGAAYTPSANVTFYATSKNNGSATSATVYGTVVLPTVPSKANTTSTITRTVSYNANGGNSTPASQSVSPTATVTWPDDDKWYTASSGGTGYAQGGNYTPSTDTTTLYAHYTETIGSYNNPSLTLASAISKTATTSTATTTFNVNGGSGSNTSKTNTVTQNYNFNGWAKGSTTGATVAAGSSYTPDATSITMYATWTDGTKTGSSITTPVAPTRVETSSVTVSYNSDGGSAVSSSTSTKTDTYPFSGWALGSTTGATVSAGANINPTASTTYYAKWGTAAVTYSAVALPTTPTKAGYKLVGWTDGTTTYTTTYTPNSASAVTLTAVWEQAGTVMVYSTSDNRWHWAIPYIYKTSDGKWHQADAYIYKGNAWKKCGL